MSVTEKFLCVVFLKRDVLGVLFQTSLLWGLAYKL